MLVINGIGHTKVHCVEKRTMHRAGRLRMLCAMRNLRCALRLIFSELRNLRCAFTKQFAFSKFAL